MQPPSNGPSGNAWGALLVDPALVSHQGRLVAFARAAGQPTQVLYFQVLDPDAAVNAADESSWNGWYRFDLAAGLTDGAGNQRWFQQQPPPQLRLAGMDLLTVTPAATSADPADAAFQVFSDDSYLYLFRASRHGTLYLTRLMLLSREEEVGRRRVTRWALEVAWEVRYRRSGLRDVPADDSDTQSALDPTGLPFLEPTLELSRIDGIDGGRFAVARVPTGDRSAAAWYVARTTADGVQLLRFDQRDDGVTNFAEAPVAYTPIAPTLASGGAALRPLAGLAPTLLFYAEQDGASAASGRELDLPRAGRLMLALPVSGGGLDAAVAIYDFALGADGAVPDLPAADQPLTLVDGMLDSGRFRPDDSSPSFPTPAQAAATTRVVGGLAVSSMVLGQVQPHTSPVLAAGEDGLVHLYHGGLPASATVVDWRSLVPGMPQAMVAQFDPRVSRVTLSLPWRRPIASELPTGAVRLTALQSGALMDGAQAGVADVVFGEGAASRPQPDLCTVDVTYPRAVGLPAERWSGVPRELTSFAAVLDGGASDDAADPEVAAGERPFFDFAGRLAQARLPLAPVPPAQAPSGTLPPALTLVSTRATIALTGATVAHADGVAQLQLAFADGSGHRLAQTWAALPAQADAWPELLGGGGARYDYVPGAGSTPLFAFATDAVGVPAPLLLYPADGGAEQLRGLRIGIEAAGGDAGSGLVDVIFGGTVAPFPLRGLPADAGRLAAALAGRPEFTALGLVIDLDGVAGAVVPCAPAGPLDLRGCACLFDVVCPPGGVVGLVAQDGAVPAGRTGRTPAPVGDGPGLTHLAGFAVAGDPPADGSPAYVENRAPGAAAQAVNRALPGRADAEVAQSGAWMRQVPHKAAGMRGSDAMTVPVVTDQGGVLAQSANLRPQWNWTLEAWLSPGGDAGRRLVTFHDGVTPTPPLAPTLDYAVELAAARVLQFDDYRKSPGTPDSISFLTGTSEEHTFIPAGTFTWEAWVQPTATPAPPGGGSPPPLGGIVQLGVPDAVPDVFSLGLTADRHVVLRVTDSDGATGDLVSRLALSADAPDGQPRWTHLAVSAIEGLDHRWTLRLYLDSVLDSRFEGIELQVADPRTRLTIGRNTPDDASMFGQLAQLRLWSTARTEGEIRRTAFISLSGSEAGLLGCWPLAGLQNGPNGECLSNIAKATGTDWRADVVPGTQTARSADDDVFLSVVATVGGMPAVEAQTLLYSGRWNHLAVVFQAGGALQLNPPERLAAGFADWLTVPTAQGLTGAGSFAFDTWVALPSAPTAAATIASSWAWDSTPDQQSWMLQVDPQGNLVFTVQAVVDAQGTVRQDVLRSSGVNLADGRPHHVVAAFEALDPADQRTGARYVLTLWVDALRAIATKTTEITASTALLQSSQAALLLGRTAAAPPEAGPQPLEDLALLSGTIGRTRLWSGRPNPTDLFPELGDGIPRFAAPRGLVAQWEFDEQQGLLASDAIGENDGELTSATPWASLRATSSLTFYANGGVVSAVVRSAGATPSSSRSQFTLGAPLEGGVGGFEGELALVSLWDDARSLETVQDQQFVPLTGSERDLLACWDFADGGRDITGGRNDGTISGAVVAASTVPITNEGADVVNVYGGVTTQLSLCTPGRIAIGSFADAQQVPGASAHAVLKRQYLLDPEASFGRAIQIGLLALVYVGQVQTQPSLIGYVEGAPPVPSENLTRPSYYGAVGYPAYNGTASVALVQQGRTSIGYSASAQNTGVLDVRTALGLFGVANRDSTIIAFVVNKDTLDLKNVVQGVFTARTTWGAKQEERLAAEWTADQRDQVAVSGDWEPFERDPADYASPLAGRRFQPANLGYALVESLIGDLYATVFEATGMSAGTIVIPNLEIPPDRNVLSFPIDPLYTKAGTLDGKLGLADDPSYPHADSVRGSYFDVADAYALAATVEQSHAREQAYAAQFDWEGRGKRGETDLAGPRGSLPADFEQPPADRSQAGTPRTGLVNRYVWTAAGGLHVERQGYAASVTHASTGLMQRTLGGGLKGQGQAFVFGAGFDWAFDLMAQHTLDVQVGVSQDSREAVGLDVTVVGEGNLRRWEPDREGDYGTRGSYAPGLAPGKVSQYRFMSFFLPPSSANGRTFERVVDPVWRRLSNDPAARALRQLRTPNPVWRVLHRVTYVERIPPPIASRPLHTLASSARKPVNVPGNAELLALIGAALGPGAAPPSAIEVGQAVAAVIDPAPSRPGVYPVSVLERQVPWWGVFLASARPDASGRTASLAAAALLARLVRETVAYTIAAYATGALRRARPR